MRGAVPALLLLCCRLGTGYVMQEFSGCVFGSDKQENIRYGYAFFFNRQLVLGYSEDYDMFLPCGNCLPEMQETAAKACFLLNTNPAAAQRVKQEEIRCKQEARTYWDKTVERTVKPSVEVFSPVEVDADPVLMCHVSGFYPRDINVAWFKNNVLVRNYTKAVPLGDWTYQIVATLDLRNSKPQDNFTCLVDHRSLDLPITKDWRSGLTNIQVVKISVAAAVFVVGLAFLVTGVHCWRTSKRSGYTPIPGYSDLN